MAGRTTADGRSALLNNRLMIHSPNRPTEHRELGTPAEVSSTLEEVFGITLPDWTQFDAALVRLNLIG